MNEVIGSILPLSMGVALSPLPIIMIMLLLGSARPRTNGLAFLGGWIAGLAVIVTVLTFALDAVDDSGTAPGPVAGILRIAFGSFLLFLAARKFAKRLGKSDAGPLPTWMAAASSYSPRRSAVMGLALSGANPKIIAITAAAGVSIGAAELNLGAELWAVAAYLLIASLTVLLPVASYLLAPEKMDAPLRAIMEWLKTNHSIMTGLLLVVFGFIVVGNGIGSF